MSVTMPRPEAPRSDKGFRVSLALDRRPRPPRKRPRRKGGEGERAPVEPPNPKLLSGGAAAELAFDD